MSGKRSFPRGRPRRVICYRVFSILERCPSGRRCTLGRRVCSREYRGFESPSLRTAYENRYSIMAVCALKRVESGDSIVSPKRASAALGEGGPKGESPSLRTAVTNCYNNMAVCALKRVESGDSNRKVESPSLRTYS